jgi:DNA polymerase-3 subunit beta
MKFTCRIEKIQSVLATISGVSVKQVSHPTLSSLLIEVQNNEVSIRATNLQVGIRGTVIANVIAEGTCAVEASLLQSVIGSIKESGDIEFSLEDTTLHLKTTATSVQLRIHTFEDFPTLPYSPSEETFTISVEKFVTGVRGVFYSASHSDIKPEISSVYMYGSEDDLVFVATDSFRLAEKKVPLKESLDIPGVIIPVKNVTELIRIFGSLKGDMTMQVSEHQIAFALSGFYCVSRVIDGVYPDYTQIIPKTSSAEITILKQDVTDILKMTSVLSDNLQKLRITIDPATKKCVFSSEDRERGALTTDVTCVLEGSSGEFLMNQRYLSECLQSIPEDSIVMTFAEQKPIIVKGVGGSSFLYLIMPMNQ